MFVTSPLCHWLVRVLILSITGFTLAFLANAILIFGFEWPGALVLFEGDQAGRIFKSLFQVGIYLLVLATAVVVAIKSSGNGFQVTADTLSSLAAYLIRVAFWAVVLIGFVDTVIAFLRVENFLTLISANADNALGRARFRGLWVHYPLLFAAFFIAWRIRKQSFFWLGLLIVLAEFSIVITRFVFSYEQAFMGDLVRFWYAALFLFASAHTLLHEGHVRVDILYSGLSDYRKALVNFWGSLILGIPLCALILLIGLSDKTASISSALINFEISQSAYGLYTKYLMAGFLVVFATTMIIQFCSYCLSSFAVIVNHKEAAR